MRVAFIDGQVIMWPKGKTIDDVLVIGEQEGGLYKLKGHPEQALVHDTVEPSERWHRKACTCALQSTTYCKQSC